MRRIGKRIEQNRGGREVAVENRKKNRIGQEREVAVENRKKNRIEKEREKLLRITRKRIEQNRIGERSCWGEQEKEENRKERSY